LEGGAGKASGDIDPWARLATRGRVLQPLLSRVTQANKQYCVLFEPTCHWNVVGYSPLMLQKVGNMANPRRGNKH
jgi:hypothetical protein